METLATRIVNNSRASESSNVEIEADLRSEPGQANIPSFDTARDRSSTLVSDGILRGSKQITLEDADIAARVAAADASRLPVDTEIDEQLKSIIDQPDPNNPGNYLHAAYFAQTGGRSGFAYLLHTKNGVVPIDFPEGLLVTTAIPLIDSIRKDIAGNPYLNNQIQEVTVQQYRELLEAGQASRSLLSRAGGLTASNDVASDAQETIAAQKRRIAELEAALNEKAAAGADLGKASGSGKGDKPFNFGNGQAE